MFYSIIDISKGENVGFKKDLHRLTAKDTKMVINENELRLVDEDIYVAANKLGGPVLTEFELFQKLKLDKK
jgi:hypothetical protein